MLPFRTSPFRRYSSIAVLGCCCAPSLAQTAFDEHVADRVVIVLRSDLTGLPESITGPAPLATGRAELDAALRAVGARAMTRAIRRAGATTRDPALFRTLGLDQHFVIELEPGSDETVARAELAQCPLITEARLDGIARVSERPNDPLYGQQWNHHVAIGSMDPDIDTDLAWDVANDGAGVRIAVLDTGIQLTHPDFAGAILPGYDFINSDTNADDDHGHGTWVAGIAAARGNNGIGVAGIAWSASLMPVKVMNWQGTGGWSGIAAGIVWAANNGADVVNLSLGGFIYDSGVENALAYAAGLDVLCIASAGNEDLNTIAYPAAMPNCMAVGAHDQLNQRVSIAGVWGSNYGPELDLIAPGISITTTALSSGYRNDFGGTSAAAPHVAGVAALVRALAPTFTQAQVRDILIDSAEDGIGPSSPLEDTPGFDIYYGRGKLDANRAVLAVHPTATRRLSLKTEGHQTVGSNFYSTPAVTDDGRYVAFCSMASDLMNGDTNGTFDIFSLDRMSGITLLVSQGLNNNWPNLQSFRPSISSDGTWVTFASAATNLVAGDGNGRFDVFVWDNFGHTMRLISQSTAGAQGNLDSLVAVVSASGRYVAFQSESNNLVAGDNNGWSDVFLRDRDTDADGLYDEMGAVSTVRVSVGPGGVQANNECGDAGLAISADGRHVAFHSAATNLVAGGSTGQQVFVRDVLTGTTALISGWGCGSYSDGAYPALSPNGRFVALHNMTGTVQVLMIDRDSDADGIFDELGATSCEIVSRGASGIGNGSSAGPSMSDDARYVAFTSIATNLVSGDTNGVADVFVRDRQLGTTTRASVTTPLVQGNAGSHSAVLTNTGHTVVFESDATNLVPGDTNAVADVFARELFQIDLLATGFCTCDGSAAPAPCGNTAGAGQGCRNSAGLGAVLTASGSSSMSRDDLALTTTQLPTFRAGLIFMGSGLVNGSIGNTFGDGRRCVSAAGAGTFRFPLSNSGAGGTIAVGPGVAGMSASSFPSAGIITAGATWNFQCWYRDASGPCSSGSNMSSAVAVTFTP